MKATRLLPPSRIAGLFAAFVVACNLIGCGESSRSPAEPSPVSAALPAAYEESDSPASDAALPFGPESTT
jgi:hypothetical protein